MLERNTLIRNEVDFWLTRELTLAEKKIVGTKQIDHKGLYLRHPYYQRTFQHV